MLCKQLSEGMEGKEKRERLRTDGKLGVSNSPLNSSVLAHILFVIHGPVSHKPPRTLQQQLPSLICEREY